MMDYTIRTSRKKAAADERKRQDLDRIKAFRAEGVSKARDALAQGAHPQMYALRINDICGERPALEPEWCDEAERQFWASYWRVIDRAAA